MVSDIIHQALADIGAYMDEHPEFYEGEDRAMLDDLADHMNDVLTYLDTPPRTNGESVQ